MGNKVDDTTRRRFDIRCEEPTLARAALLKSIETIEALQGNVTLTRENITTVQKNDRDMITRIKGTATAEAIHILEGLLDAHNVA